MYMYLNVHKGTRAIGAIVKCKLSVGEAHQSKAASNFPESDRQDPLKAHMLGFFMAQNKIYKNKMTSESFPSQLYIISCAILCQIIYTVFDFACIVYRKMHETSQEISTYYWKMNIFSLGLSSNSLLKHIMPKNNTKTSGKLALTKEEAIQEVISTWLCISVQH